MLPIPLHLPNIYSKFDISHFSPNMYSIFLHFFPHTDNYLNSSPSPHVNTCPRLCGQGCVCLHEITPYYSN